MDDIELVAYDEAWPGRFQSERALLSRLLPAEQVLAIEHGGSTAIPGLDAKPIIDIYVAVPAIDQARASFPALLEAAGYAYWADNPNRDRLFFVKGLPPAGAGRTHHIHVMEPTSVPWRRAMQFRDYLRAHPAEAQRYLVLKRELAALHRHDREAYTRAKDPYVESVLALAGARR